MESRNSGYRAIFIFSLLAVLFFLIQLTVPFWGEAAIAQQTTQKSLFKSDKAARQPASAIADSGTKTSKFLQHLKPRTTSSKYAEVEIALNDKFSKGQICDLPIAPSSDLQFLDSPGRVRLQLPVGQVKALIDKGAEVTVLRKFILFEDSKNEYDTLGNVVSTGEHHIDAFIYGENGSNVSIPDDGSGWAYSTIFISTAPQGAIVTSVDVHYEIIHSYIGDLVVELSDEDFPIYTYPLWSDPYNSGGYINETEIGITAFNGKLVNQTWILWALDTFPFYDDGYIDYWWIKVYYQEEGYDYYIQADSHPDNTVNVVFKFANYPGRVYFSRSPACGNLNPSYDDPVSCDGYYCASTEYNPCETECSYVTVLADPTYDSNQTKTVHLDDRQHIWCCSDSWERELGVTTYNADTGECEEAYVTVTVIPSQAGSVTLSSGYSYWDPDYQCYVFFSTYIPSCSYSGRARVRFHTTDSDVIYSFEQNTTIVPSSSWQTVSDSFCTEGFFPNYYQVYKMYLYAACDYDFSLCDSDGVGAWCDGDGELDMYDSSCIQLWYVDGDPSCDYDASTIGTEYEGWSPLSDGYYYLFVSDYIWSQISYSLAYRQSGCTAPIDVNITLNNSWMYQNLPDSNNCSLIADSVIVDDLCKNSSYTYAWEFILPSDVTLAPIIIGPNDTNCLTFTSRGCDEPNAISDSGQAFTVKVTVTGNDYGNAGEAEAQFGICLLGDVNNDCIVDIADRSIINAFWKTGTVGSCSSRDCDINCDGVVDLADRSIANAIWKNMLCEKKSVSNPCPCRSPCP